MRKIDLKDQFNRICQENRCSRHLRRFVASTDGTMTILALFLIMMVFTVAGFAVDVMRYDRERVRLQYALDRAVLAAADLDQELCPRSVVRDYIAKEGFDPSVIGEIKVDPETCDENGAEIEDVELQGKRKVEASADMSIETHFMKWSGVDQIDTTATSIAEESIGSVEISLVLDVSGSMGGTKLTNLKSAAKDFVDEMITKSEVGKMSISIVPYSEQVSVPDYFIDAMNTVGTNEVANCIDFQADDFTTTTFDAYDIYDSEGNVTRAGSYLPRTLHFRDSGSSDYRSSDGLISSNTCRQETSTDKREMTILQNDPVELKSQIDNLRASGWTSIDVGLKWGLTLLDESTQPLINRLANGTDIPTEFKDRPRQNKTTDTIKVLVLMTDGANTEQHMVNAPYNHGTSNIHWNEGRDRYSFFDEDVGAFLWPDIRVTSREDSNGDRWTRDYYQDHAYGAKPTFRRYLCTDYHSGLCHETDRTTFKEPTEKGTVPEELSWPDVWAHTEKDAIEDLLEDAYGSTYADDWADASTTELNYWNKDPRVASLCTKAEEQEVLIFSIAFEAPYSVKQMLKDCAIKPARYYEATGSQIERVFDSISTSIQNLRLTQ